MDSRESGLPVWAQILAREIPQRLDRSGSLLVAIDGGSASGKTTLAALLSKRFPGSRVFHMDDFFLRPEQRTEARFSEPGGNVDRERFYDEVLLPASRGEDVVFRRFDCGTFRLLPPETVPYMPLTIVEGAYSLHPALRDAYGLKVFLKVPPDVQKRRIEARNTKAQQVMFFSRWIPLEQLYFDVCRPEEHSDLVLEVS